MILKLGEARAIQLLVSAQVLKEAEGALRRKTPEVLGLFVLLLDRSNVQVVPSASEELFQQCFAVIGHPGDAALFATALQSRTDYFVTLEREHFLDNPHLKDFSPFPIGTPGDFLEWYRALWK